MGSAPRLWGASQRALNLQVLRRYLHCRETDCHLATNCICLFFFYHDALLSLTRSAEVMLERFAVSAQSVREATQTRFPCWSHCTPSPRRHAQSHTRPRAIIFGAPLAAAISRWCSSDEPLPLRRLLFIAGHIDLRSKVRNGDILETKSENAQMHVERGGEDKSCAR